MSSPSASDFPSLPRTVAIVGCGIMGRGLAQLAAVSGCEVRLYGRRPENVAAAQAEVAAALAKLVAKGRMEQAAAQAALARIHPCSHLHELAGCEIAIEAIIEDLAVKKTLFAELEDILDPHAILATNTSSLPITALAAGLRHPQRVAGFHFFNPVVLMKLVEVIGGFHTAPHVLATLQALARAWGRTPVQAQDTPGFIVNHAGRGYTTEGLRLLAEGVANTATLDAILRDSAGFRLGPCELLDLIGLDISQPVMETVYHQYYEEPRFRPQGLMRQMVAAGAVGRKSGLGFYRYGADGTREESPLPSVQAPTLLPPSVWLSRERPELAARVAPLIAAAGAMLEMDERPNDAALCIVTPLGEDATTCCAREGLDARRTVAVEALFDASRRRIVMTTPATGADYVAMACTVFGATGVPVSVIRDSAGLVAQRTVAHIVNIACEMAQLGIATPEDIDLAVTLGLGYPHGPFAWGEQLGAQTVLAILKNLESQTGDPRYRPSPWLQRRALLGLPLHQREYAAA